MSTWIIFSIRRRNPWTPLPKMRNGNYCKDLLVLYDCSFDLNWPSPSFRVDILSFDVWEHIFVFYFYNSLSNLASRFLISLSANRLIVYYFLNFWTSFLKQHPQTFVSVGKTFTLDQLDTGLAYLQILIAYSQSSCDILLLKSADIVIN